jgi:hypothetical protein
LILLGVVRVKQELTPESLVELERDLPVMLEERATPARGGRATVLCYDRDPERPAMSLCGPPADVAELVLHWSRHKLLEVPVEVPELTPGERQLSLEIL